MNSNRRNQRRVRQRQWSRQQKLWSAESNATGSDADWIPCFAGSLIAIPYHSTYGGYPGYKMPPKSNVDVAPCIKKRYHKSIILPDPICAHMGPYGGYPLLKRLYDVDSFVRLRAVIDADANAKHGWQYSRFVKYQWVTISSLSGLTMSDYDGRENIYFDDEKCLVNMVKQWVNTKGCSAAEIVEHIQQLIRGNYGVSKPDFGFETLDFPPPLAEIIFRYVGDVLIVPGHIHLWWPSDPRNDVFFVRKHPDTLKKQSNFYSSHSIFFH
jgi:hypothetical protein